MQKEQIVTILISVGLVALVIAGISYAKHREIDKMITMEIVDANGGQRFPFMMYDGYIKETDLEYGERDYALLDEDLYGELEDNGIADGIVDLVNMFKKSKANMSNSVYNEKGKEIGEYDYFETTLINQSFELEVRMLKKGDNIYLNIVGEIQADGESSMSKIEMNETSIIKFFEADAPRTSKNQAKG